MTVRRPGPDDLRAIAHRFHFTIPDDQMPAFEALLEGFLAPYDRLDELAEPRRETRYPRDGGAAPSPEDNPLGAWAWRVRIEGAASGPLAGRTIAIKDNIAVAGVPMSNGTVLLDGYRPDEDATVVERVLDAGATIVGKSVCESLCFSGGSHTADSGPVRNPYDRSRSTGGSSTGSAALVAAGEVDLAIGGDQGGSVRIPSCWSGIYGLKPTWGLVPYTGAFPIEIVTGPPRPDGAQHPRCRAAAVGTRRAGRARQPPVRRRRRRPTTWPRSPATWPGCGSRSCARVSSTRACPKRTWTRRSGAPPTAYERLGAKVTEVSIPWHRDAMVVWNAVALEGATAIMVAGESIAYGAKGRYSTGLVDAFGPGRRARGDRLSATVKLTVLAGQWMADTRYGRFYAKAQNLARVATAAYDDVLADHDLLLMPTLPLKATPLPAADAPLEEYVSRALEMIPNTAPFDVTGHPAMNVPCAMSDGLPVGMMLVGRHGDEATVLRAADAFEREVFQPPAPPHRG